MNIDLKELVTLYGALLFMTLYPSFIVYIILRLDLGIYSWIIMGACLAPPIIFWYQTLKKRFERYIKTIMNAKPKEWNVDKTVKEYLELVKDRKTRKSS